MEQQIRRLNRYLIGGWLLIVCILVAAYTGELIKAERDPEYLVVFCAVSLIPFGITLFLSLWKPSLYALRYIIVAGYFIMYTFTMLTAGTPAVYAYILPLLILLVLYHEPGIIAISALVTGIINAIQIYNRYKSGDVNIHNSKDIEIQIGVLLLCFLGSFIATVMYDKINKSNERFNEQMQEMTLQTIMTIANTIDAKDEYTRGHSRRVSEYSANIASEMGLPKDKVDEIRFIALLHDIGKIGVPDSVLNKPGKLTDDEYQLMKNHTVVGADILKDIEMIPDIDIGAKYHHERYDGKGYPDGLKGEEIPKIARIIAVADAYDAMTSTRIYRNRLDGDRVLNEIKKGVGTQFDPEVAKVMIKLLEENRLEGGTPETESREIRETTELLSRVMEKQEEQLAANYMHDELTGVYNRNYGLKLLQEAVIQGKGTLCIFDIDQFHLVNETEGYMVGDIYLTMVADLLKGLGEKMISSRFGSDEFVVLFPKITDPEKATAVVERFKKDLNDKKNEQITLGKLNVSVGIAMVEHEKEDFNMVYERADKALYVAKHQSEDGYYIHWRDHEESIAREKTSADLKQLVRVLKHRERKNAGGLEVDLPAFGTILDYITDVAKRNNQHVRLLLFTLSPNEDKKVSVDETDRVMTILERAVLRSIRSVDATTKYSSTQRIVLLLNMEEEQMHIVTDRIMMEFYRMYDQKEINIHYDSADLNENSTGEH